MKPTLICLLPFLALTSCDKPASDKPASAKVEMKDLTAQDVAWGMDLTIWKFDLPVDAQGEPIDNYPAEPDLRGVTLVLIDAKGNEDPISIIISDKIEPDKKFPLLIAMQRLPSGELFLKLKGLNSGSRGQVPAKGQRWATLDAPKRVGNYFYLAAADSQTFGFSGSGFDELSTKLALKVVRGKAAVEKK